MYDDKELMMIYENIMLRKAKTIDLNKLDYMKLLMCLYCGDIFNLQMHDKKCGCGKTHGKYTDHLNAEYEGNAQPIGIANGSFSQSMQIQKVENKRPKKKDECCKGVEFTAFFIPESATSICKL